MKAIASLVLIVLLSGCVSGFQVERDEDGRFKGIDLKGPAPYVTM